jgi:hypothetical protein
LPVAHPRGELGGRLGGFANLVGKHRGLRGGHRDVISLACVGGQRHGLHGCLQLGLLETLAFDACAHRQGQERGEVERHAAVDFGFTTPTYPAKTQARVRQPAGLHEVRFRDRQFGQGRL